MITLQASFERIMKSLPLRRSHAEGAKGPHAEDAVEKRILIGRQQHRVGERSTERLD